MASAASPPFVITRRAVAAWILYDLANTIFSFNIVSLYFPLWVVNDMGGRDGDFGLASSLSMALMLVAAPLLGALSDQLPRRIPLLALSTLISAVTTILLGSVGLAMALTLFIVANFFYQAGLIFYDALLPSVSHEANRGTIGGLGIGLGYIGSFIGIGTGLAVLNLKPDGKPLIFSLTGGLFLLLAIPCLLWVRERATVGSVGFKTEAMRRAVSALVDTGRRLGDYPMLSRFLLGRIFYADAANTSIAFMGIYVTNEVGFS